MGYRDIGLVINQDGSQGVPVATVDGPWQQLEDGAGLTIQTEWSGNVSGTFTVEARANRALAGQAVAEVSLSNPGGSAGGQIFQIGNAQAPFWRVRYVHSSGTGSLKVAMYTKVAAV